MTFTPTPTKPPTYGNWTIPRKAGLFTGVGLGASIFGIVGVFTAVAVIYFAHAILAAVIILAVTGLVVGTLMWRDKHGDSIGIRVARRLAWRRIKRAHTNIYLGGLGALAGRGAMRPPGIGEGTILHEFDDSWGRKTAMLEVPSGGYYSVIYAADPPGPGLRDPREIDGDVDNWGGWIAGCGQEEGLIGCSVTIESRRDTGARVKAEVKSNGGKGAPISRQIMTNVSHQVHQQSDIIRAWATTSFDATASGGKRRDAKDMVIDLAPRVPVIADALQVTGAGAARPATASELCQTVRAAYDPDMFEVFEEMRASNEPVHLTWDQSGPAAHVEEWDHYRHAPAALSVVWYMTVPPKGEVQSNILTRALAPHPAVPVKRVTLGYRPLDVGEAADVVEQNVKHARTEMHNSTRKSLPTAETELVYEQALKTRREEAAGAGVTLFSIIISATVTDTYAPDGTVIPASKHLRELRAVVGGLARNARLTTRQLTVCPAAGFEFGLGMGLVPHRHVNLNDFLKKVM